MRILILGASGLVGSNLVKYLSQFYTVYTTSRSGQNADYAFDLTNKATYACFNDNFDVIINCVVDYNLPFASKLHAEINCKADLLLSLSKNNTHFIDISSISATPENKMLSEYNFSKFLSDELTNYICSKGKTDFTILRFAQIFDFEEKANKMQKALYYFIDSFRKQNILNVFGDANAARSYIPIDILVKVVNKTIAEKITGIHNIIMPDTYSANDLINVFNSIRPFPASKIVYSPNELATSYQIPNCSPNFEDYLSKLENCVSFFRPLLSK